MLTVSSFVKMVAIFKFSFHVSYIPKRISQSKCAIDHSVTCHSIRCFCSYLQAAYSNYSLSINCLFVGQAMQSIFRTLFALRMIQPASSYAGTQSNIDGRGRGGGASHFPSFIFCTVRRKSFAMPS